MKGTKKSFVGQRPIFTGSPSIVQGGFNLDVASQKFNVGDTIPAGSLAIFDEQTRKVQIIKTGKVLSVNSTKVTLYVDEFYEPIFAVGDKVAKAGAISGTFADAVSITAIKKTETTCEITLSAAISGLAADNVLVEVVADASNNAALIGTANAVTVSDADVKEDETGIDVTADTLSYSLYERRVPAIPADQKATNGLYLVGNVHVKLTQSY